MTEHEQLVKKERAKDKDRQERMSKLVAKSRDRRDAYAARGYKEPEAVIPEGDDDAEG